MDIEKLLRFCAVVDYGSMSKAAEKLYCSQPALSKQIIALEKEIGYPLFERSGKKLTLNHNGQLVYTFGRHLEHDYSQLKADLYAANCRHGHEVSFGATNCIGTYYLPPVLIDFKKRNPDIPVSFTLSFFTGIMEMLNQDIIAFALVPEDDETLNNPNYICSAFYDDEMVVVFPKEHPLAAFQSIPPQELSKYPYLISQVQSATRRFILARMGKHGVALGPMENMYNTETIKQSILKGMGISILSRISVTNEERLGFLKTAKLDDVDLSRKWYIVRKKSRILLPEYNFFIQSVLEEQKRASE
ncbi:MAG: LysR family transcriptional regulator [Clostridia bacterium]|nr:LysR family transcriptional regulator [Clostridia bacterium]